jgi:Lambda phage tail tube protein, TTP
MSDVVGYGTVLSYGTATYTGTGSTATDTYSGSGITGTFTGGTPVARIMDLQPVDRKVTVIDSTSFDSLNATKEKVAGFLTPGSVKFTAKYDATSYGTLRGLLGVSKGWLLQFPNGNKEVFSGFLASDAKKIELDGLTKMEFEIEVSGVSSFATS